MGDASISATPTRLGQYQVLKHLATGGMAEVLLATATGPDGAVHHVVLKRIRPDQARDDHFVRMFLDEASLASQLHHPNIVKVHEIGAEEGEFFFAMEYVHGEDLRRVLMEVHRRKDMLPIALVTGIVAAAAAGLHHAHQLSGPNRELLGIVHRDVSPANILVGYDGSVKVADFGIAKAALRTVETRSGTLKGKVSYMSPEQVTGRPIDRRSDVFALGIVLYEVATARRLFKGDNDFLTMSAIVSGDIPLPSVHRPDLPRVLEEIIMKALAPSPQNRFQSAEELHHALERFTTSLGMRMSVGSIADYMKKLFGSRVQPWMVEDEATETTTIDFDGSASGLVRPPDAARGGTFALALAPTPSSPISYARTDLTGEPRPDPTPATAATASSWATRPSGSHDVAWMTPPPLAVAPRSRRRLGIVIGAVMVTAIAGIIIASQMGSRSVAKPSPVANTVVPPPVEKLAEPAVEPTPDPVETTPEPVEEKPATSVMPKKPLAAIKPEPKKLEPKKPAAAIVKAAPEAAIVKASPKKPDSKKPEKKPKTPKVDPKGSNWDPNALFPK